MTVSDHGTLGGRSSAQLNVSLVTTAFSMPGALSGPVELFPGFSYPAYRLMVIAVGLIVALALYLLVAKTRIGMHVRAGAQWPARCWVRSSLCRSGWVKAC